MIAKKRPSLHRKCLICGNALIVKASHSEKGEGKYCSRKCMGEGRKRGFFPPRPNTSIEKKCPVCSKSFFVKKSHASYEGTYCSKDCMALGYKEIMKGSSNPNFKGKNAGSDEYRAAMRRKWRKENPEKISLFNKLTRAKRNKAIGSFSQKDLEGLWRRQQGKCVLCGCCLHFNSSHIDHIIPLAKGGTNFIGNIQILCEKCNVNKKKMTSFEFRIKKLKGIREDEEQMKLMEWAYANIDKYPELRLLVHPPNGGFRHKATALKLQKMGVKAGLPDLMLFCPRKGFSGLFIELKVGKNKPTKKQQEWLDALNKQGYQASVAWGFEEAREIIEGYLGRQ